MIADLIAQGGPVMYALSGCSLVAVAIVLDRAWFWVREAKDDCGAFLRSVVREEGGVCSSAQIEEAVQAAQALSSRQKIAGRLTQESERLYERAIRNLSGLDTVVSIAPLLGILGTVMGIMKSFHALDLQHMAAPGAVGHGLAEAMITTAVGISIAVPTLVFYNAFHSMAARRAASMYKLAEDVLGHAEV